MKGYLVKKIFTMMKFLFATSFAVACFASLVCAYDDGEWISDRVQRDGCTAYFWIPRGTPPQVRAARREFAGKCKNGKAHGPGAMYTYGLGKLRAIEFSTYTGGYVNGPYVALNVDPDGGVLKGSVEVVERVVNGNLLGKSITRDRRGRIIDEMIGDGKGKVRRTSSGWEPALLALTDKLNSDPQYLGIRTALKMLLPADWQSTAMNRAACVQSLTAADFTGDAARERCNLF